MSVKCRAVMVAVVLVFTSPAPAQDAESPAQSLVLFDGKSLDGWRATEIRNAGAVGVEDGAIVMARGKVMTGITSTREDLPRTNYELVYEARRIDGSDFFAAATFPVGKSHITLVNGGWGGSVTGLSSLAGADASENDTTTFIRYENGKWYRFRVWVTDETIRAWVDDKVIIDVDLMGRAPRTRIEVRRCEPLGFATWDTSGAVRKVEIRPLKPEELALMRPKEDA